jgi:hypothetical protein
LSDKRITRVVRLRAVKPQNKTSSTVVTFGGNVTHIIPNEQVLVVQQKAFDWARRASKLSNPYIVTGDVAKTLIANGTPFRVQA